MTITPDDLVRREVYYCVSSLVSTLAQGYGCTPGRTSGRQAIGDLTEQAMELAAPVDDWEEAAIQAGWKQNRLEYRYGKLITTGPRWWFRGRKPVYGDIDMRIPEAATAREACEHDDIDPYQREVFEHWIVSDWLADKLAAKGEKVDKDFAGLTVWARTTTGQGIACDWVIEAICAELNQ